LAPDTTAGRTAPDAIDLGAGTADPSGTGGRWGPTIVGTERPPSTNYAKDLSSGSVNGERELVAWLKNGGVETWLTSGGRRGIAEQKETLA
jgi:hypothetical protein